MKIELNENKILFNNGTSSKEIHPFWLRERVNNEEYLDKKTQQRKFDPTSLETNIEVKSAKITKDILEIKDLEKLAKKRVPKMFFDYVNSGSWTETTYNENVSDYSKIKLRQRVAVDMTNRKLNTKLVDKALTGALFINKKAISSSILTQILSTYINLHH